MATKSFEERVTVLEVTVASLQSLPNGLAEFRRETNARFDRLEQRLVTDKEELYTHMRVLHEELVERIRTIRRGRDGAPPSRRGRKK